MKINVPGLEDSTGEAYPVIPVGQYPVRITGVDIKEVGATDKYPNGSNSLMIKVKVCAGEENADHTLVHSFKVPPFPAEMEAKTRNWHTNTLKRLCLACGFKVRGDEFDTDDLHGAEFVAVVEVDIKGKNQITDFLVRK